MSNTRVLWRIAGTAGLLATLVLTAGLVYGIRTVLVPQGETLESAAPSASTAPTGQNKLQILALGDSLTRGVGDDDAEGYVGKLKKLLAEKAGKPVFVWNYAVSGATSTDMLADIAKPTAQDYISQADIILFTIGGNDLNRVATQVTGLTGASTPAPAVSPAAGTATTDAAALPGDISFDYAALAKEFPSSINRLETIIDKLAAANPKAQIVYVGLYHPFAEFDPERQAAEWIGRWNNAAFVAANRHSNVTVVPTYDLFQNFGQELLYTDHFHPNTTAYEQIAARVAQVIRTGG
ncbi:MAG: Lipase/Acylhydrolase with GDSL-like motif [Paenibacillaceae bacterium]|nr:Lipase/Acylhydrolase with GDSL-like motif [Paenibacillaceae bacterium]